jgi:hypothetical protein
MKASPVVLSGAERVAAWIDSLSPTLRPAAYGALVIVLFMLMRGAWIVAPILVLFVLLTSHTPVATLGLGLAVIALAMVGGALSGLAYGVLGRHVQRAFRGAWYLTGVVTIAPYMFVLPYILRIADHKPFFTRLSGEDVAIAVAMALLFGLVMGATWFAPERTPD